MTLNLDHDYFWKHVQQEFGAIPVHLQNILQIQNMCTQAITALTRESIMNIEKDMRELVDHLTESWQAAGSAGPSVRDIYGPRWANKPQEFRFLEGEILCLLGLADFFQTRNIEGFFKFTRPPNPNTSGSTPLQKILDEEKAEHFVDKLITKIKGVYLALNITDPDLDQFLEKLDHIKVQWLPTIDNQMRAAVMCPVCASDGTDRRITLKVDPNGRWNIWSFTRHCDTFHYAAPRVANKRKQFLSDIDGKQFMGDIDDVMDDSVSDTTNHDIKFESVTVTNSALS